MTIPATCALSARPLPLTAALTSLGVCRATGMPRRAAATIATALGEAAVAWRLSGDLLELEVTVPFGAEAELDLPVGESSVVTVDGVDGASAPLRAGTHRVTVTHPLVADAARALAGSTV